MAIRNTKETFYIIDIFSEFNRFSYIGRECSNCIEYFKKATYTRSRDVFGVYCQLNADSDYHDGLI